MPKKGVDIGIHEHLKAKSAQGFDTPGLMPGWLRTVIIVAAIVAVVVAIYYIGKSGTGQHAGGVRNCILSVMGNPPDCSDNDGTLKKTYANGRYVGVCKGIDNSGNCMS
jgi:hypothetical protein